MPYEFVALYFPRDIIVCRLRLCLTIHLFLANTKLILLLVSKKNDPCILVLMNPSTGIAYYDDIQNGFVNFCDDIQHVFNNHLVAKSVAGS